MRMPPGRLEPLSDLRILAVEDHEIARQLIVAILSAFGAEPDFAECGEEAMELASAIRYDVALLDLGLPDMDGEALASRLVREAGMRAAAFVAVTGLKRPTVLPAPFGAWVEKPYTVRDLHDAILTARGHSAAYGVA
jgi:CheY-like chemotaxis protein